MIGHPKRIIRKLSIRLRDIGRILRYSRYPMSYKASFKWGCVYYDGGKDNVIDIASWCHGNLLILINGSNNRIHVGKNVRFGSKCAIQIDGNNCEVYIGDDTTFTRKIHLACEAGKTLRIDEDCMFSYNIVVRTSDSHTIFDINEKEKLNHPADVIIGKHVWVGPNVTIGKGVNIGEGSVVASNSVVTHTCPNNCLLAGAPAQVKRENISWSRSGTSVDYQPSYRWIPGIQDRVFDDYLS